MKIALINPSWSTEYYSPWLPLGILYVGTILDREGGFSVKLLDAAALQYDNDKTLRWVKQTNPDIVGISAFTVAFLSSIDLARKIKEWNPSIKIVMGHYHPTITAENILQKYGNIVDFCVRGEGEYTFLELVKFLERYPDKLPSEIQGLTFKDMKGTVISTLDVPLIEEMDKLPFPDRKLIDFDYKWNFTGFEFMDSKFTTMISSRGCPFSCNYCACSKFARRRWRPRSPENIIDELSIVQDQGYTELNFVDDNFTLNSKRVIKLCELMKKEHIDINWHTDGRVDQVSQAMLGWMHAAGCRSIWYGFESANQRILDLYNKKTKVEQFSTAIHAARKAKIDIIVGLFMVGGPTETLDEVRTTLKYGLHADVDVPFFNIVDIFPGIKFWQDYIDQGTISPNDTVRVKTKGGTYDVERWETSTSVIELTLPPRQHEIMLREIQAAQRAIFSAKRISMLLKQGIRLFKSPFMLKMVINSMSHVRDGVNAFMKFRDSKPKGFGTYIDD